MTFEFRPTEIPDVIIITPRVFSDQRGFFMETWHADRFREAGLAAQFVQDSYSRSTLGTLRGLHYQTKHVQGKLIRVICGEVFDVAVDLRRQSKTFGRWVSTVLSAKYGHMVWIPPGFAHGFYVTSSAAELVYKCTDIYAPEHEIVLRWDDPELGIDWPLADKAPLLSVKDAAGTSLLKAPVFDELPETHM